LYETIVSNGKLDEKLCSNDYSICAGSVYMVFKYNHHDLTGVLSQTQFEFAAAHLKSLCYQMLAGLVHLKGVLHCDIKGSNILINNCGELKLADFGLAQFYQKQRQTDYTNCVITFWYCPPELVQLFMGLRWICGVQGKPSDGVSSFFHRQMIVYV